MCPSPRKRNSVFVRDRIVLRFATRAFFLCVKFGERENEGDVSALIGKKEREREKRATGRTRNQRRSSKVKSAFRRDFQSRRHRSVDDQKGRFSIDARLFILPSTSRDDDENDDSNAFA